MRDRPLDPTSLRLFVAVCEEGNIARAAEREAMVASALSKRISALEAHLGGALLSRGRRGIEPTALGLALLTRSRELLGGLRRLQTELRELAGGVQGSVRVVAAPSALAEPLAEDIGAFMAEHPSVRVSLDERVSPEIVRAVREGSADIGVLWDASSTSGLATLPWRKDHLCLAARPPHPFAGRRHIGFAEALPQVAVGIAPGGMMDTMLQREAARLGLPLSYRIQVSSMDTASRVITAGLGAGILPREALSADALAAGVQAVPLREAWATRQFVLCHRAESATPVKLLLHALAQSAQNLEPAQSTQMEQTPPRPPRAAPAAQKH
jgi:DNA-binding transcriptional LysR family regulator